MKTGEELRDLGITKAVDHANEAHENWTDIAYRFLIKYIETPGVAEFMVEDVRKASEGVVPAPPSNRAWGGIIIKAAKAGIIKNIGYRSVKNPKAHRTPASIWIATRFHIVHYNECPICNRPKLKAT